MICSKDASATDVVQVKKKKEKKIKPKDSQLKEIAPLGLETDKANRSEAKVCRQTRYFLLSLRLKKNSPDLSAGQTGENESRVRRLDRLIN